ncbi:MAG: hypothetical protein NFW16_20955 [Candidatus Accumulibacter sp.]|uniref:tail completion protein gp17 n=1 Tax=Accumulibacter sp. TaxID=2053492 RepID=UPI00258C3ED5|nr:DUF3168 domain-containing protein [Accumulibacter sp.]MCM8624135.1 hypothetical protein [Accumulibacter sp.]
MTIEQTLVAIAAPLLAGGLHPNLAPQNGARPYGVYTLIVSPAHNTLSDGQTIQQEIFQVDVWADTYQGALAAGNAFSDALHAAFDAGTIAGVQRSRRGRYDAETGLHGFLYEFSFWHH